MLFAATPSFAQNHDHEHKADGVAAATSAVRAPSNSGKQHMQALKAAHDRVMNASTLDEAKQAMADAMKLLPDCVAAMQSTAGGATSSGAHGNSEGHGSKMQSMRKRMKAMHGTPSEVGEHPQAPDAGAVPKKD